MPVKAWIGIRNPKWRWDGPILACPYCKHPLIFDIRGICNLRGPTKREIEEYAASYPTSPHSNISRTHAREETPERDEGESGSDG